MARFPAYVSIGGRGFNVLRHIGGGVYYRDAGAWEIKLVPYGADGHLRPHEDQEPWVLEGFGTASAVAATRDEWLADNGPHTDGSPPGKDE